MALLAQTTLRSDSSFATTKTKKIPGEGPETLARFGYLRKMALGLLLQKLVRKGPGSNLALLGVF